MKKHLTVLSVERIKPPKEGVLKCSIWAIPV